MNCFSIGVSEFLKARMFFINGFKIQSDYIKLNKLAGENYDTSNNGIEQDSKRFY